MNFESVGLNEAYWFQEGPGVRNWQFTTKGIKLINVANIRTGGLLDLKRTDRHLAAEEVKNKYSHFLIEAGDLVIASSGITIDTDGLLRTRGAFVSQGDLPLCLNTSVIRFKAIDGRSDLNYLRHWLQSPCFRIQITREVTGIAQKNFGPSHLKKIKIPLPPLEEQRRIAAVLDKVDELRRKRQQAIERLDDLVQSVFLDMFGDPVTTTKVAVEEIASSKPRAMRTGPFGSNLKHSEFVNDGIPVLGIDNVVDNVFKWAKPRFITEAKYEELQNYRVYGGDILVTIMGTVGRTAVVPCDIPVAINTKHLVAITPDPRKVKSQWLAHALRMHPDIVQQLKRQSKGAIMDGLNLGVIRKLSFHLPSIETQELYCSTLKKIEEQLQSTEYSNGRLQEVFNALLHKAFNGELFETGHQELEQMQQLGEA